MKFEELYNLVLENEQVVIEEGFFNKLKIFAIGALLGFPAVDFEYQRYKQAVSEKLKENPEQIEQVYQSANDMAMEISKTLPPEVKNQIAKADPDTSMRIIQQAVEEKPVKKPFEKQQVVPVQPKKQASILSDIKEYIKFHEISNLGIRNNSYADSKGYATIGIGHLILKSEVGPGKLFTPDEISYKTIKGEKRRVITISDEKALEIFNKDFNGKVAMATSKSNFPRLLQYPENLQKAILDGFFRGDISSRKSRGQNEARANIKTAMELFFKYEAALKAGQNSQATQFLEKGKKFLEVAATNYLKHHDLHDRRKDGVDKRMKENANLIRSAFDEYMTPNQQNRVENTPNL
jgi:hypothetical protein